MPAKPKRTKVLKTNSSSLKKERGPYNAKIRNDKVENFVVSLFKLSTKKPTVKQVLISIKDEFSMQIHYNSADNLLLRLKLKTREPQKNKAKKSCHSSNLKSTSGKGE